ncbi:hypothetical protein C0Q70_12089 [Pomacea canaliculata]|uniref:GH10 domain-containing protein n=1 Tax=Pomacea canaliculata TaxID=400727 RepID=A0A2T7P0J5_POMCA|nr:hypothetical protein C0Q70_12089 [Pomacea canaliculata]
MQAVTVLCTCLLLTLVNAELLKNGDFEAGTASWNQCWGFVCKLTASHDTRFGKQYLSVTNRTASWMGPGQGIQVTPGKDYRVQSYIKILNDLPGKLGQRIELEVSFDFPDGTKNYVNAAVRPLARTSDGWFLLRGDFQAPSKRNSCVKFYGPKGRVASTTFYFQGPDPGVGFAVDQASVTEITSDPNWRAKTDDVINRLRKSDINVQVTAASGVSPADVKIQIVQTRKSYPFGMGGLSSWKYVDPAEDAYRDWVHKHFNWATPGNMLKWRQLDWHSSGGGTLGCQQRKPTWTVVPGEVQDIDYDLELFRMVHAADPDVKLFLNDYNVVAQGAATDAFLAQGLKFKAANVGLYGMGVQVHFLKGQEPSPTLVKERLDTLAKVGVPLWVTELSAQDDDPNREADFYERGLRALYGHPAVEGIVFWEFEGYKEAADVDPISVRVLDLLEKQWMTNDNRPLAAASSHYTVRGFHGDYELRVVYKGHELTNLRQTFTLGTGAKTVSVNDRLLVGQGRSSKVPGKDYRVRANQALNDLPVTGQRWAGGQLRVSRRGTKDYVNVAVRPLVRSSDGWFLLRGDFQAPSKSVVSTTVYCQGPDPGVGGSLFGDHTSGHRKYLTRLAGEDRRVINRLRKSEQSKCS